MIPSFAARARLFATRAPRWLAWVAGLWVLAICSAHAMGGWDHLWTFELHDQVRFTSMAMLDGRLELRHGVLLAERDEQVFNGAAYTNWGYGAPLLELPFHAVARWIWRLPWTFFPDRAIYFVYLVLVAGFLWFAFDRLLASRPRFATRPWTRLALSWSAVLLVVSRTLFPLMSAQFLMYQETICYMVLCELLALGAYVLASRSWSVGPVLLLGAAAGLGLLVRPTTVVYVGVWGALVLLEGRSRKNLAAFAAGLAPFLGFWLYSNHVRSGGALSFGYANGVTSWDYNVAIQRFGNPCTETARHTLRSALRLFRATFLTVNESPPPLPPLPSVKLPPAPPAPIPWYVRCHDKWELRPPDGESFHLDAFLGPLVLVLLAWILASHLVRRERRLAVYVPFLALATMFFAFAREVPGFSWRYVGDYWPLIVLVCVQYVRWLPQRADRALGFPLAAVFALGSWAIYMREIEPARSTVELIDPHDPVPPPVSMWGRYVASRDERDAPLPTDYKCTGDPPKPPPFDNGLGWVSGCGVLTMTNLFFHVPENPGNDHYHLRFDTEGMSAPVLRVYVNGRIFDAHRNGDEYTSDVVIHYAALHSPSVMVTIEWTHEVEPPPGRLLRVELGA